jgi:ligand-binding sensor domain-containing protein
MSFLKTLFLRLFGILLFLFIITKSNAQEKGWQELTISDGLSQGMCHDITQDKRGFVWIGTNDGLNRYDGHNFKVFTHDPYDEYSISGNACTALFIDSQKRLWVGTQAEGLNLYNEFTHQFYHIDLKTASKFKLSNVNYINEDPDGNLWVSNYQGEIFKITFPNSLKKGFPTQSAITNSVRIRLAGTFRPDSRTTAFAFDPQGTAYICDSENFFTINWKNPAKITALPPDLTKIPFFSSQKQTPKNCIWMAPATLNRAVGKEKILPFIIRDYPTNEFQLRYTASGKLLIASLQHLWLLKNPAELFTQEPLAESGELLSMLQNQALITTAFEDNSGTVWVGTNGFGLRKFTPRVKQFQWYLPHRSLNNLYQDKQARLYAFVDHRYQFVNRQTNTTKEIFESQLSSVSKIETCDLIQDRVNRFWLAITILKNNKEVNYLVRYSGECKLEKKYLMPDAIAWSEPGVQILEDRTGKLWLTSYQGKLVYFDPSTERTKVMDYSPLAPNTPTLKEPTGIYQDHSGIFWVGTKGGLVKMDASRTVPQFWIYSNSTESRKTLSNNHVTCMIDDPYQPQKYLWVSTKGGGLERLDKQTGTFEHFTEKQGLPNKVVYGILEDERNNLWMSTNRGLSQLNPKTGLN